MHRLLGHFKLLCLVWFPSLRCKPIDRHACPLFGSNLYLPYRAVDWHVNVQNLMFPFMTASHTFFLVFIFSNISPLASYFLIRILEIFHTLWAKWNPSHDERGPASVSLTGFVEGTSEVKEGGRSTVSPFPTAAGCLLGFDLLPQVSWWMDKLKGRRRGNAQRCFPVFFVFSICEEKSKIDNSDE